MNIIIGLGNPGKDYAGTRHNVGFEVIDQLAHNYTISVTKKKHKALIGEGTIKGKKVVLIKPQTYMNLSGESIKEVLTWYKCNNKDIIIIYDDISLDVGEIRVREKGSAGGHNGMKSIIQHLLTDEFIRIRIGVGEKPKNWDLADYVLSQFSKNETESIAEGFIKAGDACETILDTGVLSAMNKYNQKKRGE